MLQTGARTGLDESHEAFRDSVLRFFAQELHPNMARWEADGIVDRDFWRAAGAAGLHTELFHEACDRSLQLHGGAGYMNEYPIARLWRDARVNRIFGGTSEIMKVVIGRAV